MVLLQFLGKYSTKLAELAARLPKFLNRYYFLLSDVAEGYMFECQAVCNTCDSHYRFEECLSKVHVHVGSHMRMNCSVHKCFGKKCNEILMKEIVTLSGQRKFYPYTFCFTSVI